MNFAEAFEKLKDGKVCSFQGTEVRLVKIQEEFRGETLSTHWKFQNKDKEGWVDLNAINTSCLLVDEWTVATDE